MTVLICNGDSWTFGSEIIDPELVAVEDWQPANDHYRVPKTWPVELAKEISATRVINLGWPADDNGTILERTIDYLSRNYINRGLPVDDLLVVIGWSSPERNSFWYDDGKVSERFRLWPNIGRFNAKGQQEIWKKYVEYLWNPEEYIPRFITTVLQFQTFCDAHGINWLCFNAFYQTPQTDIDQWQSMNISSSAKNLRSDYYNYYDSDKGISRIPQEYDWDAVWQRVDSRRFYRKDFDCNTFKSFIDQHVDKKDRLVGWHPSPTSHSAWASELARYYREEVQ